MAGKLGEPLLMFDLVSGDYRVTVAPDRGGSILRFDWQGEAIFRPVCGPSILDVACFPLVPFSNRIAHGRFEFNEREVGLSPNFPGSDHPHPLHGFGWLSPWRVASRAGTSLTMTHSYDAGEWPWVYSAEQILTLDENGLTMELALTNEGSEEMPAGLGFHPYFPRDRRTRLHALHRGEWRNDADCLPDRHDRREAPMDWWAGQSVEARAVDTVYTDRSGPMTIEWPSSGLSAQITCSESMRHTVIFSPPGSDFFCVEPVTNETNAFNRGGHDTIAPSKLLRGRMHVQVNAI